MRRKFNLTKEELKKLYLHDKLTIVKIAKKIGMGRTTVGNWLKKYNIPRRKAKPLEVERIIKKCLNCEKIMKLLPSRKHQKFCCHSCRSSYNSKICWENPKYREKLVKIITERNRSKKHRELISNIIKELHKKRPDILRKKLCIKKPNKKELIIDSLIQIVTNDFKYNGDFSLGICIGGKVPDWVNVNGQKKVIELFGRAFHDPKFTFRKNIPYHQTYEGTIEHYKKYGFDCLIIWDDELKNPGRVLKKICEFHDN